MKLTNQTTKKVNPNKGRINKHIKVAPDAHKSPMDTDIRIKKPKTNSVKTNSVKTKTIKRKKSSDTGLRIDELRRELEDVKWALKQAPMNHSNAEYRLYLYETMSEIEREITAIKNPGIKKHWND